MTDLICDADGIRLSPGIVLAERRGAAIVPHHAHEIFRSLAPAFGADLDWTRLNGVVGRAARFLTEGRLDAARKAIKAVRLPQPLAKFNPNHYGPGPRGGQFAPADGADAGATGQTRPVQVAQDERDPVEENDATDPMVPVRQALWNSSIRALREIDPNNPALTYFTNPNSAPSQAALDQLNETLREAIARHAAELTTAGYAARNPALAKPVLQQILQQYPAEYANARAAYLQSLIPEDTRKHLTMGIGIVEDEEGTRYVLISSSEQDRRPGRLYLRPQVDGAVQPDEIRVPSSGHAEINILQYAKANNLRLIAVGAGRPYCPTCGPALDAAGVLATGPRRR